MRQGPKAARYGITVSDMNTVLPAAISTGIGSQVQQPLACVIIGGMLLSPICSLLVIPTLARLMMPAVRHSLAPLRQSCGS